jgi:hypothetical protein
MPCILPQQCSEKQVMLREVHIREQKCKRRKLRGQIWFLYRNEYRIFKPDEATIKKETKVEGTKREVKQFRLYYIYTWKCHKETPCVAILNKQKCLFFFFIYKIKEQESRTGSSLGVSASGSMEEVRKGCRRVNMVQILCTHVYKWKNDIR